MSEKQELVKKINDMVLDYNIKVIQNDILDCKLGVSFREISSQYNKIESKYESVDDEKSINDIVLGFVGGVVITLALMGVIL